MTTCTFAHRGGVIAGVVPGTIASFQASLRAGATGVEADAWLTSDGVPVLSHRLSRRRSGRPAARDLPDEAVTLDRLYAACGSSFQLSLDMTDAHAADVVVACAREHGGVDNLWLTHWRLDSMRDWRQRYPGVHLVFAAMALRGHPPRRRLARIADAGADVFNTHHTAVSSSLVETAAQHKLAVFAWGIRRRPSMDRVLRAGVAGVYANDVAMMVEAARVQR